MGTSVSDVADFRHLLEDSTNSEIPVFGSSFAMTGYYPDSLGPEFYNYGRPAYNLQKIKLMLDIELNKNKQGPILIDFHMGLLKAKEQPNVDLKNYLPFISRRDVREFLKANNQNASYQHLYGLRYYGLYQDYIADFLKRDSSYPTYYHKGGEFYRKPTSRAVLKKSIEKNSSQKGTFTRNPGLEQVFFQLLRSHPDRKFILIISPYHKSIYRSRMEVDAMWDYLKGLKTNFDNIEILKFDGRDLPDDHFRDAMHLNEKGARLFSAQLKKELISFELISPAK
jgi:hypothetical protein